MQSPFGVGLDVWRVIVQILTVLLPFILGGIIFWLQKYFVRKEDLNGLGARVNEIGRTATENATAINKIEQRLLVTETSMTGLARDQGKLEAVVERLEAAANRNKSEIIAAFQDKTDEINRSVSDLRVDVGRLDERVEIVKELLIDRSGNAET